MIKKRVQKLETLSYEAPVTQHDIDNGDCRKINKCMIRVANERTLREMSGESNHHTKVDAGHLTFHWDGYRYIADMPKIGKASLIKFDREEKARRKAAKAGEKFVSGVKPFPLKVNARRLGKLPKNSKARRAQINKARRLRIAGGQKPVRYTLRDRIVGFA